MKTDGRKNTVLISGFMQTGNTWVGLVVCNYFNILNFDAKESLMKMDVINILEHNLKKEIEEDIPLNFKSGFPSVYQTHNSKFKTPSKTEFFNQFDKFVYIWRNPYDTMISLYHNRVVRKGGKETLKHFTERTLPAYLIHVKVNIWHADLVLFYDDLRSAPEFCFGKLLKLLVHNIDDDVFKKTLEMSSFENIHRLELKRGAKFPKTRDGRTGQYTEVMDRDLIDYITEKWMGS